MGLWEMLAKLTGVDKDIADIETDMASDEDTPVELLRRIAMAEPDQRAAVRANPNCPPDLAAWIDEQAGQ